MEIKIVMYRYTTITAQRMKFSIKDFFSRCDQKLHLLKKSLMENFIFCAVDKYFYIVQWNLPKADIL